MAGQGLTERQIRRKVQAALENAIAEAHAVRVTRKHFIGEGLYLHINTKPVGSDLWRMKYTSPADLKETSISFGPFPRVSIEDACEKRDAARKFLDRGVDPVSHKRAQRAAKREQAQNRFKDWSGSYYKQHAPAWSATHRADVKRILDELCVSLGAKSMASIDHSHVEQVLHKAERRGALHVARDMRLYFRLVWRHYNQRNPRARLADPSADVVFSVELEPVQHHPAIAPHEVGEFLRKLKNSNIAPSIRLALRFLLLTSVRSGELRFARWDEIDSKAKLWRISETRMKSRKAHLVPLSKPVLELLPELRTLTDESELLFPSPFDPAEPMSEGTLINAIKYGLGYRKKMTAHGVRTVFSTWCSEQGFHPEAIERQLAHAPRDKVRDAYSRAEYIEERRKMMEAWAKFCAESEAGAKIIPLRRGRANPAAQSPGAE